MLTHKILRKFKTNDNLIYIYIYIYIYILNQTKLHMLNISPIAFQYIKSMKPILKETWEFSINSH